MPTPQIIYPHQSQSVGVGKSEVSANNRSQGVKAFPLNVQRKYRVEDFIGLELTMIPEVEYVFVEKDVDDSYIVSTIVNARDLEVRSRVYERELAIFDAHPGIEFEFNIISRRNRPLEQIITSNTKPYKRIEI
ncbi:MAG: hypothetical protein ACRD2U_01125 [Terriglobales bacterium]